MLLLIDNYDSFTHNLARYFVELGQHVEVVRHDQIDIAGITALAPEFIVLSPGPCTPNEAGISLDVVATFKGKIPILGVCLGHQTIAQHFGASIVKAQTVMHGKTSLVHHADSCLFSNVTSPFQATRYHSLVIDPESLATEFEVTAWVGEAKDKSGYEIMAIEHKTLPLFGVQFHPESLMTEFGHQILSNFLTHNTHGNDSRSDLR
ncbi:aminodeoxychorismate/anthranilate synthase component II [Alteromonas sp. ASW11-36]|uniref:Aminodeoxychorismate/anthranilate synthase component II n=1 Tax=Alteromonas arenosi TaxID=3055817 RepID=A0ABT7SYI8_9ALTE|nr:aminodeoxychorismate/anthranilate synthase component II [Alteromonas sp. ASW11-36]MDM7861251.1 aminodeoxychorismate/anthranilate synthase component II [Alteromonas sp. ASW11-36]